MAKKSFSSGLDNLLTPTISTMHDSAASHTSPKPKTSTSAPNDELVSVLFRIPVDLKIRLDTHCAKNRISKQDFITSLIEVTVN